MAPIRVGCSSRTERTIRRFSPDISFNPILLLGFCIEAFNAIIRYIFRLTAQTGRKPLARDKNLSYSSEVYDSEAWNSYLLSRSKSELKQNNPLIRMDDRQRTALESGSAKMNSLRLDHRDNSDNSLHGVQKIVSLLANCGSKNLDVAAAKTKENIGFLRGLVPSFWTAGTSEISSNKGTELGDEDVNFEVPLTGKTMKVPEEHTCIDWSCYQPEALKLKTTSCDTDQPSDGGTTQENSQDSGQKGGQTIPDTGKTAAQVSKSQNGSSNYRRSSGSSGGDDGEDGPRQNVPVGSCQGDSQCSVDTSKEHEQQPEEQSQQGGDCPHNQDSMTIPSSTENSQDKTGTLNPKEGQTPTDEGTSAAQVSKSLTGCNNHFCSSLSSGEDAKDDSQRWNISVCGCQKVSQNTVDDSKKHEKQPEESIPASVLSDTENSKDKSGTSNQKEVQATTGGGNPAGQVSKTKQEGTNYCRSSSGSGGDDGGEDRKRNLPPGGCQGDGHCEVGVLDENKPSEQDHQEEEQSLAQKTENSLVGAPSFDGAKKSAAQGLRIDVAGARMIAEAGFKSQPEAAGGLSLIDQFKCGHPEADLTEAEQRLQQAFTCRHHLNSENEWKECSEASCREIQEYVYHSQNCRMHVLGGCKKCICYKESLLYHTSGCHLPMGACVVPKCDTIREYLIENELPNNRKWKYQLDQLFFKASPPTTPTSSPEKGDHSNGHFMAQLLEAALSSRSAPHDDDDDDDDNNLDHHSLIGDESQTSPIEESLRESSGVWNHYHVDRPPELLPPADQQSDLQLTRERSSHTQVTRGPTVNAQVRLEEHVGDARVESTTPISAACIPDVRETVKHITQEEKGEVIWPLDQRVLSVSEDGSYIEGIHWRRVKYIGGGSCGRCFYCEDTQTGFLFAIKRIPVGKFQLVEIDTWGSISGQHPNILELYGAVKHKDTVVIFMEYMEGGSVEEYGKLSEGQALHILGKVISAVEFMHSQRLLHRDIKGGNVLLDATGQKVKLADFGTTIRCDGYLQDNNPRGTEAFMAPEVCRSEQHSFSADIWGIMCFLYQMLVGKPPWMEFCYGSLLFKIGMASQPPQSPPCSPEVEDLFSQGFVLQPSERATAAMLLRHRVFVTAPCVSDIQLPSREELWLDEDSSFSSNTSDSDTESLASEQSIHVDVMPTGFVAGNYDDHQEEWDNDDDNDGEPSDGYDDSSSDLQEPDLLGDEDAMFIEGTWQGLDLSAEEQLQSLQCELFLNLEGQDLERALNEIEENADVNDNDINLLRGEDFNFGHFIDELLGDADMPSIPPLSEVSASSEWSYSITDLTKLHIQDSNGNLVFTIRERPSTSYGKLAEDHHGNIASVLQLDAFTLTREDGAPLNVRAEIGFEEQAVRVVPAHDTDNWQPYRWRVDIYGRVEEFFEI